ncbi:MAG: hypothetical protein AVDCRST_MAG57-3103, partial [uncultured Blastococcus sp.]
EPAAPARRLRCGRAGRPRRGRGRGRAAGPQRPPRAVLPGRRGAALREHAADPRGLPRVGDQPHRARRRRRARLERAGVRREARGAAGHGRGRRGRGRARRDQHVRRRPAGVLPGGRRGQGRGLRRVLRRLADRLPARRRRPRRDAVLRPARGL